MTPDHEMGWDEPIEHDDTPQTLLPEGEHDFEIVAFKRERHTPKEGGKLPACPKAIITLRIIHPTSGEAVDVDDTLFLHSKCEGIICSFFTCIGQRKSGEKLTPDWGRVVGARGRCRTAIRTWEGQNGPGKSNDIKKYIEPTSEKPAGWTKPDDNPDDIPF